MRVRLFGADQPSASSSERDPSGGGAVNGALEGPCRNPWELDSVSGISRTSTLNNLALHKAVLQTITQPTQHSSLAFYLLCCDIEKLRPCIRFSNEFVESNAAELTVASTRQLPKSKLQ